ncbi:MAG: carbon-nitrogen hydrolase family protein [Bryobacteraceae bacterium]|nr:carbon-nitrogen hydrolase family protein [Bryobacteraceae bacterium]
MKRALAAIWLLCAAAAAQDPAEWSVWSARGELRPETAREGEWLIIRGGGRPESYGGWVRRVEGVRGGAWYRFSAEYEARGVAAENWQVVARVDWLDGSGRRVGQPEYAAWSERKGEATVLWVSAPAPPLATSARIELLLANAPSGEVRWRNARLEQIPAPAPRRVRIAAVNLRPERTQSAQESVDAFLRLVDERLRTPADLILLPEGITVVGTGKSYVEVAESVPGPTTAKLGELARRHRAWVAAGIYERDGRAVYNTAVLVDREGRVAGRYRKVYLPREEVERGLTPGHAWPVFDTDFGRVGMMICYDVFFPDPARALAAQGAELILLPIWGGDETLAAARAIENRVFLAASGYDHPTYIMDPDGKRVAQAPQRGELAVAEIDLARRYPDPWLGDMRTRRLKEIRMDVPMPFPGRLR